jgi:hypothetical protein
MNEEACAAVLFELCYYLLPFGSIYLLSKKIREETGKLRVEPVISLLGFYGITFSILMWLSLSSLWDFLPEKIYLTMTTVTEIPAIAGTTCIYYFLVSTSRVLMPRSSYDVDRIALTILTGFSLLYPAVLAIGQGPVHFISPFLWNFPTFLIALSYVKLAFIFRRIKMKSWHLAYVGGLIIILSRFFESIFWEPKLLAIEKLAFYGDLPALIGGILAIVPSVELYSRLREKITLLEPSGVEGGNEFRTIIEKANAILGGASLSILKGAVDGYNQRNNKSVVLGEDLEVKGLEEGERNSLLVHIAETFYQCVGPLTFDIIGGVSGLESQEEFLRKKYGGNDD